MKFMLSKSIEEHHVKIHLPSSSLVWQASLGRVAPVGGKEFTMTPLHQTLLKQ